MEAVFLWYINIPNSYEYVYTPNSYEVNRLDRLPGLRREREKEKRLTLHKCILQWDKKKPKGYSI